MPLKAQKLDEWYIDEFDPQLMVYARVEAGGSAYYKREHHVVRQSRRVVGVTEFVEDVGDRSVFFKGKSGPTTFIQYVGAARKNIYVCTGDRLAMVDALLGEMLQTQTWEHWTDEELMPDSEYKEAGA